MTQNQHGFPDPQAPALIEKKHWQALDNNSVFVPLTHLALLHVKGVDSQSFLHNQLTSDVNHLGAEKIQHSTWCSAKGRVLASFLLWQQKSDYRLLFSADLQESIARRLPIFILRSKVSLDFSSDVSMVGIAGKTAAQNLKAAHLPCPADTMTWAGDANSQVLRLEAERFIVIFNAPALPEQLALQQSTTEAPQALWQALDIAAAFPLITKATTEAFVPQMVDFDKIGGVSFHKGCYPGQEIVARTHFLGKVKRRLFRLQSKTLLQVGDTLFCPDHPEQAAGTIISAAPAADGGFAALAVILENLAGNLCLAPTGAAVTASAVNPDVVASS